MKILALEVETSALPSAAFEPHLKDEARVLWELLQADIVREVYFRQEWHGAVLILECPDATDAQRVLGELPLVRAGLIRFDIIPLIPYPGFARLFAPGDKPGASG